MNLIKYILITSLFLTACSKKDNGDTASLSDELAQNVGDMMAGVDESGGSSGSLSLFAEDTLSINTTCYGNGFGSCNANTITRNFNDCTVGLATISGAVTIAWGGGSASNCALGNTGDYISRNPNFTITGPAGGTINVAKTGSNGQRLTWDSGTGINKVFSYSNDGIRRWVTTAGGNTISDFTTTTQSAITVSGTTRSNRIINGGTLRITNNLSGETCDIAPSNVTWSAGCTCASSGSWSGTCSDGSSVSIEITSCGAATLTLGTSSTEVSFDRCSGT